MKVAEMATYLIETFCNGKDDKIFCTLVRMQTLMTTKKRCTPYTGICYVVHTAGKLLLPLASIF